MNETCCEAQGGLFGGSESHCGVISGACCLEDRMCVETNLTCCESQGGLFAGAGSVCRGDANSNGTDDACDDGFPTVSHWGLVVMVLVLLVGIRITFARRV